jgi:hypothetical protein
LLRGFFAGVIGIVVEFRQLHHPAVQVGKTNGFRIDLGMGFREFDGDIQRIGPLHLNVLL